MVYTFFILLRFLDIWTTYNCLKNYCSSELNPFNAFLINSFGLNSFIFINLLLSLIVLFAFYKTNNYLVSRITLKSFLVLNLFVVSINFLVLF